MQVTHEGDIFELSFSSYAAGPITAIRFIYTIPATGEEEVFLTATCFLEDLRPGEVAVKNWSENEGVLDTLLREGIVKFPHRHIRTGYVMAPVCYLTDKAKEAAK